MSSAPRLSHLQFLVLGTMLQGPRLGREIRGDLHRFGVKRSGPGFYQLMGFTFWCLAIFANIGEFITVESGS